MLCFMSENLSHQIFFRKKVEWKFARPGGARISFYVITQPSHHASLHLSSFYVKGLRLSLQV